MTDQEAFNKIWERAKDKRRAVTADGKCRYRGLDGLCCFVGVLIPDDQYRPCLEGIGAEDLPQCVPALRDVRGGLLESAQLIHDGTPVSLWGLRLRKTAVWFELEIPE